MKGLVVNSDKKIVLKDGLIKPAVAQGEVLVEVKSASVNPFDAESAEGRFDPYFAEYGVDKEVQTGLEFAGVIKSDGQLFKNGDKVFGYVHMITGWKSHAEYIAIDENYLALMPGTLSYSQAAAIPLGALTALVALQDLGHLKAGMKLLINGAAGGLGIQGIQIGKILGAHITAIAGSQQEEYLHSYGADRVYDYNQTKIADIADTFDVILDLTNVQKLENMKVLLTPTGIFIPAEANDENGGLLEDPQVGFLMVAHGDSTKLTQIANWVSEGRLKAVIDREFNFVDYQQAIARVNEKGRRGRITMSW
jgi:NADPH:quinone reductase-like Zn-dependent oxidoreductase